MPNEIYGPCGEHGQVCLLVPASQAAKAQIRQPCMHELSIHHYYRRLDELLICRQICGRLTRRRPAFLMKKSCSQMIAISHDDFCRLALLEGTGNGLSGQTEPTHAGGAEGPVAIPVLGNLSHA